MKAQQKILFQRFAPWVLLLAILVNVLAYFLAPKPKRAKPEEVKDADMRVLAEARRTIVMTPEEKAAALKEIAREHKVG